MGTLEKLPLITSFQKLGHHFFSSVDIQPLHKPFFIHANKQVAKYLDLYPEELNNPDFIKYFNGNKKHSGFKPLAMVYSGHQFGGYSPQLGDGRGLLLAEVKNTNGHWDLYVKGAGLTPYSRSGDGRAVLRSSIREYLCSQAMQGLNIPTSHALGIIGSEENIYREEVEPGAILIRVAESHVRFGSFEYFFHTQRHEELHILADYVIDRHFCTPASKDATNKYSRFFEQVVSRTARLIADWQAVGFTHGVLNTDNMSILGETFDYGPYGFLDAYEPNYIPNHSDYNGRYAFDQQPSIGLWNCNALAHALSPLIDVDDLKSTLHSYETTLLKHYYQRMSNKLGIYEDQDQQGELVQSLLGLMAKEKVDYNIFFRSLCYFFTEEEVITQLPKNQPHQMRDQARDLFVDHDAFDAWTQRYAFQLNKQTCGQSSRQQKMLQENPKYILRNYMAHIAIDKAQKEQDFTEIDNLITLLQSPYDEHEAQAHYAKHPPDWGSKLEISCSS